jgi:indole-3-glycerol phosphate synthase
VSTGILERIVRTKRAEVRRGAARRRDVRARAGAAAAPRPFAAALRRPVEVALLAEVKRRSPSAGEIRAGADPAVIARAYRAGGAAALSVLTDREYFGGSLEALVSVRAAVDLPVMRKDFLIDPSQVWEARAAGADAVLLIVRILDDDRLGELLALSAELGMDALVETHDREELARALEAGAKLVGINNRDLDTLVTSPELAPRLAVTVPAGITVVAESGLRSAGDVERMGRAGVDAVLVGEALMRRPDVSAATRALVGVPRSAGARPP